MKSWLAVAVIGCATLLAAQTVPAKYEIDSWKKGTTQVQEQTLNIPLSASEPDYDAMINDSSGQRRFHLAIYPVMLSGPHDGIAAWHVSLTEPGSQQNLLTATADLEQEEFQSRDYLWWLYPGKNTFVPLDAPRIIYVESFYVGIKVDGVTPANGEPMQAIKLTLTFSNSPPHLG
jgi:hypothetical protein